MAVVKDGRVDGGITRGREIETILDGRPIRAFEGESVAAALLLVGYPVSAADK